MGVTKVNFIREFLFRNYSDFPVVLDKVTAAAIQVSLWEIVRENSGTFNLGAGDVQCRSWSDDTVRVLANTMLSRVTGNGPYLMNVDALALAGGVQDTLVQHNNLEPAASLVVAPGLIVLAIRRRHVLHS